MGANTPAFSDADRARLTELHGLGHGRNECARLMGRGLGTVSRYAAEMGLDFDREPTAVAVAARQVDLAARRAAVAEQLMSRAEEAVVEMAEPYTMHAVGQNADGSTVWIEKTVDKPPAKDRLDFAKIVGLTSSQSMKLVEFDQVQDSGVEEARGMLNDLSDAARALAAQLPE